jgi:hypothetical protein
MIGKAMPNVLIMQNKGYSFEDDRCNSKNMRGFATSLNEKEC